MPLIPGLVDEMAAAGPVVSVAGRSVDFDGLAGASGAVAAEIAGMRAVGVRADASLETVVAVIGALRAGVTVVPIPPDAGPMERQHIERDSGMEAVLHDTAAGAGGRPAIPVDVAARADFSPQLHSPASPHRPPPSSGSAGSPAMVLYTSGTTGLPKGVALSAEAITTDLDLLAAAWEWSEEDVLAHGLPLFHVHGLILGILGALRVGSRLIHTGRPTPQAYAAAARRGATLFFGVPTVWSRVADDVVAAGALRAARLLVSGSAGLPVPVFERLRSRAGQGPIERYGMTETLITISGTPAGERRPGWVGRALPGVATRLVDDDGAPVAADGESVGDLQVRAPTVMDGYLNRPDANAEVTTDDGWFRTGDVACVDAGGWHRIVGRRSTDLIKSGGYRIGAGEVEAALLAHPDVAEAAVVGHPDEELGQVIVAYVVAGEGVTGAQLTDFVAGHLSVHKRPRRVELIDALPRNAMGKVQKKLLLPSPTPRDGGGRRSDTGR